MGLIQANFNALPGQISTKVIKVLPAAQRSIYERLQPHTYGGLSGAERVFRLAFRWCGTNNLST